MRDTDDIPTEIPPNKITVDEAARVLGITTGAVRNRLSRGTLESVKENGTVFVLLPPEMSRDTTDIPRDTTDIPHDISRDTEAIMAAKDETIRTLKEQLDRAEERDRENRRIIAGLVQRIPAIEAPPDKPSEPRESPETVSDNVGDTQTPPEQEKPVSWWRKLFGP